MVQNTNNFVMDIIRQEKKYLILNSRINVLDLLMQCTFFFNKIYGFKKLHICKLYNDYPLLHKFLELVRNFYLLFNSQQIVGIEEKLIEYTCSHTS